MSNKKPQPVTISLKTVDARVKSPGQKHTSLPIAPQHKRVFTDEQWERLCQMDSRALIGAIAFGNYLIHELTAPDKLNMKPPEAAYITSNLRFQREELGRILKSRGIDPEQFYK